MRRIVSMFLLGLAMIAPALADDIPYYEIPKAPRSAASETSPPTGTETLGRASPRLEPILRGPDASAYGRAAPPVYAPPPTATAAPRDVNTGPVTGYGAGGMQTPPGSPVSPPYTGAPFVPGMH